MVVQKRLRKLRKIFENLKFRQNFHIIGVSSSVLSRIPILQPWFPEQDFCLVSRLDGRAVKHAVNFFKDCAATEIFRVT